MAERQNYNTKARQYIVEYLEQQKENTVSANNIIEYLNRRGNSVNRATVYRYLNKLSEEHRVIKFVKDETQEAVYQFVTREKGCDEHIHIKCVECGRLIHLNCGFMSEIKNHLFEKHNFSLQCESSILYGVCEDCRK